MDVQTQDAMYVSEKEQQLTAPPGWTKKLVPASAKSITLRKYDVVFISPDGQEVKSKWHLNRYLKAHPDGPASSEFLWSTGEEAPVRRSTRFATKEASEDNKSTSRRKGKRNASELEAEEIDHEGEETASRKRAKKTDKSAATDEKNAVEDAVNVSENNEVMDEAIAIENEALQAAALCDEVQKDENAVEVEASKEAVTEKATDEVSNKQEEAEKASGSNAVIGGEHEDIQLKDEGLDKQVEAENATVSSAILMIEHEEMEDHEEIQVKVVEVQELLQDKGLHAENECKASQDTDTLVAPAEEFKVEEVAMETKIMKLKEHFEQKLEENEIVACKITAITPVAEECAEGNDKSAELEMQKEPPSESPKPREDSVEPLMQNEEQERPPTHAQNSALTAEHIKDKSPSEFSSSSVPVTVVNE